MGAKVNLGSVYLVAVIHCRSTPDDAKKIEAFNLINIFSDFK